MLKWFLRRKFWDSIALVKYFFAKPVDIKLPPTQSRHIYPKPLSEAVPKEPLDKGVFWPRGQTPREERTLVRATFYDVQVWLYTTRWKPRQPDLPRIDLDPEVAL